LKRSLQLFALGERDKSVEAALGLTELFDDAGLQRAANALRQRLAGA